MGISVNRRVPQFLHLQNGENILIPPCPGVVVRREQAEAVGVPPPPREASWLCSPSLSLGAFVCETGRPSLSPE